jgi:hypothetical protein
MALKRLGKKPARPGAIKFAYSAYTTPLVTLPRVFGHVSAAISWGDLGNGGRGIDGQAGDCVVAGAAHETMLWTRASGNTPAQFTTNGVLDIYKSVSGWNGRPDDPSDTGLDMQQFAEHRRAVGIYDAMGMVHRVKAYAAPSSIDEVLDAVYKFGACGVGIKLPSNAGPQFDDQEPWSYDPNSQIEGGHYVTVCGRNSRGNITLITWGALQAATHDFLERYMDEAVAYLSTDYLTAQGRTPELLDEARLDADLAAIG